MSHFSVVELQILRGVVQEKPLPKYHMKEETDMHGTAIGLRV
jgi:hypothetical protein